VRIWGKGRIRLFSARRLALAGSGLALVAGVLPVAAGFVLGTTAVAHADDVTTSQNLLRNGWDNNEPNLSPATVKTFSSAPRWTATVDGSVYAQPLVLGSTVIVATESDWVYGLNAGTGAQIWATRLGSAYPIVGDRTFVKGLPKKNQCLDLVPNIGITGTPAYDSGTGHIFMFADIVTSGAPAYYMVEMDPTTGAVISKTLITGHPSNDPHVTFSAKYNMERPGVLVLDGGVFGAFASHCDTKPYDGYVARVDISSHTATLWSDQSGVTYDQGGIWQSGGGIMSDGSGRIFVTSGNGVSPPKGPGTSPGGQLAESVIRLAVNSNGTLSAQDFFSPANAPKLDSNDTDFGSGGPVGVQFPIGSYSHTMVQIGKDGRVFLLNRDSLGGREQGPRGTDNDLFVTRAYGGGEWGHPAIFGDTAVTRANSGGTTATDNDFLLSVAKDDVLRVFRFAVTSTNKPRLTYVANSSLTYGYTSGSPVVTSNGDDPTTAVIWEVYVHNTSGKTGSGSVLEAYSLGNIVSAGGTPSPCLSTHMCTLTNIWHSNTFTSAKFSIPATSQGWVYVGTRDGHVLAFAAPSAAAPAVATAATLPQAAVGSTSSQAVSVTATKPVTITGATASTGANNATNLTSIEFGVGQASETMKGSRTAVPVTFPVTLAQGDKLNVQTKFTPTVPGTSSGTLALSTSSSTAPTVDVPLTADGTKEGIYAQPSTQTFPLAPDQGVVPVPVGIQKPEIVDIANLGTVTQTITSVTVSSPPFSVSNLPAVGTKLIPGASISVQVTYTPTSPGPVTGSFIITGSSGQKAVVTLTGIGTAAVSQLTAPSSKVNFGKIRAGRRATAYIHVSNTGNTQITVTGVARLRAPFAAPLKAAAGLPLSPGSDLLLPVIFAPNRKGTFTTQYMLHWSDVNGMHTLIVTITGTAVRRAEHEDARGH
jgi:hypothetical protein